VRLPWGFLVPWALAFLAAARAEVPDGPAPTPAERVGASEVVGKNAPALVGRRSSSVRVYAFRDGSAAPIPFQVDERDRRGTWANDDGPQPVRDDTPGIFDDNDVIVFMNRDLGAQGDPGKLPEGASKWLEVRVGEPSSPTGFAYVGAFDAPPSLPAEQRDYAHYVAERDEILADRYTVRFGAALPTFIAFVHRQGEDGRNVLNSVRAHGQVKILAGLFRFERSEKDLQYTLQGWRDGPVRAIRSAKYWIRLPLGFKARGRLELLFYRDFVEARAQVKIRFPPRLVPADGWLTAYFDFRDFADGRVMSPNGTLEQPIDGTMTEAKREFTRQQVRWSALLLPNDQIFLLATRLGGSLQRLDQRLYLEDSNDPARGKPSFGFTLSGVNRLETGEQELSVNAMVLEGASPTDGSAAASVLLQPPDVAVKALDR
jgi:hypothetical protein